ncbi:hypothetical protein VVT58_11390 [Sphingobium sp. SJ10-10]|uniref:hypothetical protein n=1 Tax=Sphingobium sp. SJ10-10 TaxID=3114999 RepID=UPI002E18A57F|nr:hypothetical protein [Sphingobium sp. SJ10-10]
MRQRLFAIGFTISILLASLIAPASVTQAQGRKIMETTRKADMKTLDGPAEYFTGKVTITGQFQRPDPSRVGGAIGVRQEAAGCRGE